LVQAVPDTPGWQLWQALSDFVTPVARKDESIQQPAWQLEALQTLPVPQPVPSARFVQSATAVPGLQTWQALLGFAASVA
jgi:hypothetical protein